MRAAGGARAEMGMQRDEGDGPCEASLRRYLFPAVTVGRLLVCDVMNLDVENVMVLLMLFSESVFLLLQLLLSPRTQPLGCTGTTLK